MTSRRNKDINTTTQKKESMEVGSGFFVSGVVFKENDCYTSLCLQFDIAGQGSTPIEAINNNIKGVEGYLKVCLDEGKSIKECYRPAPLKYHILYSLYSLRNGVKQSIRTNAESRSAYFHEPIQLAV